MENHAIVKASEVAGVKVFNGAGENLGKINEVVLDKVSGEVKYLVLDFGGFMGFGNKFFPVPWNAVRYDAKEEGFLLDVDEERLKKAPGFDKDNWWPNFADRTFLNSVTEFYRV